MIVLKFGGSSLDTAEGIARMAGILRSCRAERPVLVVSAMGKTTRRLLECAEVAAAGDPARALALSEELRLWHRRLREEAVPRPAWGACEAAEERVFGGLSPLLARLAGERRLGACEADRVAACGELVASEILALALPGHGVPARWLDARRLMVTDGTFTRARPLYGETGERLRRELLPLLAEAVVPVLGGYIGATAEGVTTTLGKEGSDFSAAIVGEALGAREVQLWTDVDGLLTADPRLVPGAHRVATLSFAEALELACSGAKKPHPGTLEPAGRAGVPIRIRSSLAPAGEGTLIGLRSAAPPAVRSIACRANAHLLVVRPREGPGGVSSTAAGSLAAYPREGPGGTPSTPPRPDERAIPPGGVAEESGTAAEALFPTGVLAAVERLRPALLVLELDERGALLALDRGERLAEARAALAAAGEVGLMHGRAVISLVSEDFAACPELVAQALAAACELAPRLVSQGAAAPAVRCLVEEEDLPSAVTLIHSRLFGRGPGEERG